MAEENPFTEGVPEWLIKLESRKKTHRLAHEADAGSPCLKCIDKCPGLDLHFWRKMCRNCKCKKEEHDIQEDDYHFDLLLRPNKPYTKGTAKKTVLELSLKYGQNNTSQPKSVTLDWVPPNISPELASEYMEKLPINKIPISSSAGAKYRRLQIEKQIPHHDFDPHLCHELTDIETKRLEEYAQKLREKVGQGRIVRTPIFKEFSYSSEVNKLQPFVPIQLNNSLNTSYTYTVTELNNFMNQPSNLRTPSSFIETTSDPKLYGGANSTLNQNHMLNAELNKNVPNNKVSHDLANNVSQRLLEMDTLKSGNSLGLPQNSEIILTLPYSEKYSSLKYKPFLGQSVSLDRAKAHYSDTIGSNSGHYSDTIGSNSRHCPDTIGSNSGHCPDTIGSNSGHYPNTIGSNSGHYPDTSGSNSGLYSDTIGPNSGHYSDTIESNSRHYPNTIGSNSGHYPDTNGSNSSHYSDTIGSNSGNYLQTDVTENYQWDVLKNPPTYFEKSSDYINKANPSLAVQLINEDRRRDSNFSSDKTSDDLNIKYGNEVVGIMEDMSITKEIMNCVQCLKRIDEGTAAVCVDMDSKSLFWHPECFVCSLCKELLVDLLYSLHKGKVYCCRDYAKIRKIPRCYACDELIFGSYTFAEGQSFHIKHFCCLECDMPLPDKDYTPLDGHPVCLDCYDTKHSKVCSSCNQLISLDKAVSCGDHSWHANDICFNCPQCQKSLINCSFFLNKEKKPFCSNVCIKAYQK